MRAPFAHDSAIVDIKVSPALFQVLSDHFSSSDGRAVDEPVAKGMLFVVLGVLIVWLYSDDMVIFFHKVSLR